MTELTLHTLTIKLTEDHITSLMELVEAGTEHMTEKMDAERDYTAEDIAGMHYSIECADEVVTSIRVALATVLSESSPARQPDIAADSTPAPKATLSTNTPQWLIYSAKEAATRDGAGFWSLTEGWVPQEQATEFCANHVGSYALPQSLGQDRGWFDRSLLTATTEAGLVALYSAFCNAQGLQHDLSADDLLAEIDHTPANKRWLEQFLSQWDTVTG